MARWSNSRTRMSALAAMMVLFLMTSTHFASAHYDPWGIGGKEFRITNIAPLNPNPYCPGSTDNTVTFYPSSSNPLQGTVVIVGDFAGADLGLCYGGSEYSSPPGLYITYAIYGDLIILQIPDRVPSASKIVLQQGRLFFIGLDQFYYVSQLTYLKYVGPGPAH